MGGLVIGVGLVGFFGCKSGGPSGDTVAVVNGAPISQDEYLRYMMLKPSIQVESSQGPVQAQLAQPIGFQAFSDIVKQRLLVQMAKDKGVYPTNDEIVKEINFQLEADPNYVKRLTSQGLDMNMIKEELAIQMSQDRLITKGITVTPQEVQDYIDANPAKFTQPATFDADWILVHSDAAKKQVDDELRRGQPFDTTAQRFSEAPSAKENKGAFQYHQISQLPKELQGPIEATPPLKTTDWIKATDGSAKFYIVQKTPATKVEITPHLRELVRRQLALQRGGNASELNAQIQDRLKAATVNIKLPGLQDNWDLYMKALAQQSSSAPSAAAGSATGTAPAATGQ